MFNEETNEDSRSIPPELPSSLSTTMLGTSEEQNRYGNNSVGALLGPGRYHDHRLQALLHNTENGISQPQVPLSLEAVSILGGRHSFQLGSPLLLEYQRMRQQQLANAEQEVALQLRRNVVAHPPHITEAEQATIRRRALLLECLQHEQANREAAALILRAPTTTTSRTSLLATSAASVETNSSSAGIEPKRTHRQTAQQLSQVLPVPPSLLALQRRIDQPLPLVAGGTNQDNAAVQLQDLLRSRHRATTEMLGGISASSNIPPRLLRTNDNVSGSGATMTENGATRINMTLPTPLYLECDGNILSVYQCLIRKQIEFFEASPKDIEFYASKMNNTISVNQVGIRCRHCAQLPMWSRTKASVYYPGNLSLLYQSGQNMTKNHLTLHCKHIPSDIKERLLRLKDTKRRAQGGMQYWADAGRALGLYDTENGLRFQGSSTAVDSSTMESLLATSSATRGSQNRKKNQSEKTS